MDFLKRFKGLLLDATVGFIKQYRSKSIGLMKLKAAVYYLRAVQIVRRHVLIVAAILFLVETAAVAVIVVPFVWLALSPGSRAVKFLLALLLGVIDIGVPLGVLAYFLSEKKWMELSKSDELVESVTKKD